MSQNLKVFARCLEDILEECGVLLTTEEGTEHHEEDHWGRLSLALFSLSIALTRFAVVEKQAHSRTHSDLDQGNILLEVESAAQQIHEQLESFMAECQERCSFQLANMRKAESILSGERSPKLRVIVKSLRGGIRSQLSLARAIVQEILDYLPKLYSMVETGKAQQLAHKLTSWGRLLQQRCTSYEASLWQEAVELLDCLQFEDSPKNAILGAQKMPSECASIDPISSEKAMPSQGPREDHEHDNIVSDFTFTDRVLKTVKMFLNGNLESSTFKSILIVGPEGSGKSSICDNISNFAGTQGFNVIRPQLPLDLLGTSVGVAEDKIFAMLAFALSRQHHAILLLDDAEHIFGDLDNSTRHSVGRNDLHTKESHVQVRSRSTILLVMDALERMTNSTNKILLVCTSSKNISTVIGRFDETHIIAPPASHERKKTIVSMFHSSELADFKFSEGSEIADTLSSVVDCSIGMHYGELAHHYRKSLLSCCQESVDGNVSPDQVLAMMKSEMQTAVPSSLRGNTVDDFVDMTVWTARDMPSLMPQGQPLPTTDSHPLFGESAQTAWQELNRLIILPLCRSKELDVLLHQEDVGSAKTFCSGVLLTGPPGCGKSAISYASAIAASSLLPSIKLVDVSCTSLIHKEVGQSERSVHKLFECCRAAAPCILLMDGIENVAAVRENDNTTEGTMDRVLSTLLTELDGVDNVDGDPQKSGGPIAIIGITHSVSWIDPALRRPGRLEKVVNLGLPEKEARYQIALREIKQSQLLPKDERDRTSLIDALCSYISDQTEGLTGAGVVSICNEAKLLCAREAASNGAPKILAPDHFVMNRSSSD